jgi:RNA polymerase sigma-70 factor (family 1)
MSDLKHISDIDLTYLVKMGIKEAFKVLFERYGPKIYTFALSYLKNENDAEELVQEVFVKVWEKRDILDKSKNIKFFLYKVAVNAIYDKIRHKNIETAFKDFIRENSDSKPENTWHTVIYNELLANVNELVKQMPHQQGKIFSLSKEEGLSNDDIAKKMNLSKRTVENQLYRAIAFLRKHFYRDF